MECVSVLVWENAVLETQPAVGTTTKSSFKQVLAGVCLPADSFVLFFPHQHKSAATTQDPATRLHRCVADIKVMVEFVGGCSPTELKVSEVGRLTGQCHVLLSFREGATPVLSSNLL